MVSEMERAMRTAIELYPEQAAEEAERGSIYGPYDYDVMLQEFGNIELKVDEQDYSGDSWVLYRNGTDSAGCWHRGFGYLQFGWGSCSGCDALQGCEKMSEVQELMNSLNQQIQWFSSKEEALNFFQNHDWEADYSGSSPDRKRFTAAAIELLKGYTEQ